ncbi:unnamed protein product [Protopolystoma xenopodis]|uniref:DUF5743 domain-containing protein n=1 Tax=Protopolystoma xenopodis TaxID=117903 RepID=A0A3S4ZXY4_9PLAT|nr:unnamed protein product [Protopolystoma xenopodis]
MVPLIDDVGWEEDTGTDAFYKTGSAKQVQTNAVHLKRAATKWLSYRRIILCQAVNFALPVLTRPLSLAERTIGWPSKPMYGFLTGPTGRMSDQLRRLHMEVTRLASQLEQCASLVGAKLRQDGRIEAYYRRYQAAHKSAVQQLLRRIQAQRTYIDSLNSQNDGLVGLMAKLEPELSKDDAFRRLSEDAGFWTRPTRSSGREDDRDGETMPVSEATDRTEDEQEAPGENANDSASTVSAPRLFGTKSLSSPSPSPSPSPSTSPSSPSRNATSRDQLPTLAESAPRLFRRKWLKDNSLSPSLSPSPSPSPSPSVRGCRSAEALLLGVTSTPYGEAGRPADSNNSNEPTDAGSRPAEPASSDETATHRPRLVQQVAQVVCSESICLPAGQLVRLKREKGLRGVGESAGSTNEATDSRDTMTQRRQLVDTILKADERRLQEIFVAITGQGEVEEAR